MLFLKLRAPCRLAPGRVTPPPLLAALFTTIIIDLPVLCHEMQICHHQVRSLFLGPARQLPQANLERLAKPETKKRINLFT